MTKKDFAAQKSSLESIAKALRPLRLKSLEQLEFTARARLLTTVLRIQRQPKPAAAEAPAEAAPPADSPPPEAPPADAAPAEEGAPAAEAAKPAEPAAPKPPDPVKQWEEVQFAVGQVWRAVGDHERAEAAFASSGRQPSGGDDLPAAAAPERAERGDRPPRAERPPRGERHDRPPRPDKLVDWQLQARDVEEKGRTRDAAKIHERHKSWAEAARLWMVSGDKKMALRAHVMGKDLVAARALLKDLKPEEFRPVLEQAQGWELLMEHYVSTSDFENVAKLYERARQFDQAALAWERANKFSQARKAFERANDTANATRMREAEVKQLIERGDRLGAATILVASGEKDKAVEALKSLPPPKAYRFMERLKLEEQAKALAEEELKKAETEGRHAARARWLETLGRGPDAIDAWIAADRKDKALPLIEQTGDLARAAKLAEEVLQYDRAVALYKRAGDTANAERVAALPKPQTPPPAPPSDKDAEEADEPTPSQPQG